MKDLATARKEARNNVAIATKELRKAERTLAMSQSKLGKAQTKLDAIEAKVQGEVVLTKAQEQIVHDSTLSKSERMRRLFSKGLPTKVISRVLGAHYSFVHNVVAPLSHGNQTTATAQ